MKKTKTFKLLPSLIAVSISIIIWFVIPIPDNLEINAWKLFSIFVGIIFAIITKALPIGALGMISIAIIACTGITNTNKTIAISDALSGFSNQLIWLIGTSIMIAVSLNKTGLGKRIGYYFIALFGKKTVGIAYSLVLAETILAPVTPSNTARGGGIIHPIMKSIADSFNSKPSLNTSDKIGRYLSLVNFNINPITSAMFITATAPNPLIVNIIMENTNPNFEITWSMWATAAIIPGIFSLIVMPIVVYWMYPPIIKITPDAPKFAEKQLKKIGKIKKEEIITLCVFIILLIMWADIPSIFFGKNFSINPTTAALIGLSILFTTGVLEWDDILNTKGAWDTIVWFSALIMMSSFLSKLGFIHWFSEIIKNMIHNMDISWFLSIFILLIIYVYSHYLFASTTSHIMAMFAAFFTVGITLGAPPILLALMLSFSSSLMMSLTHYSTGTAPIIFGSGYATLSEWWKTGFILSVVNLLIWILLGGIWWKILGYW
ncbi:MAG: DASS family sodium-coupled anion symporter [Arsenophonus sp.]|nr:MAG: DASS family sodium-coupled anion symporter [Arsenophonus sp.]